MTRAGWFSGERRRAARLVLLLWSLPTVVFGGQPSQDVRVELEAGVGYDSNPAQVRAAQGAAFANLDLGLAGPPMATTRGELGWRIDAWYRAYEGMGNTGRIALSGSWDRILEPAATTLAVSTEAVIYRDEIVPTDSRNEVALRAQLDGILTPRLDLMGFGEVRWLDYLDPAFPWEGRPGPGRRGALRMGAGAGERSLLPPEWRGGLKHREDWQATLGLEGRWHVSAKSSAALAAVCVSDRSTIEPDGYNGCALDLSWRVSPAPKWQVQIVAGGSQTLYERTRSGFRRQDTGYAIGAALERDLGAAAVRCELQILDNQSNVAIKSFRQTVTQCGLVWQF
jgi:hypothetical protein